LWDNTQSMVVVDLIMVCGITLKVWSW